MAKLRILKEDQLKESINHLKSLDLRNVDTKDIIKILDGFGLIIFQTVIIEPGQYIFRSRVDEYGKYFSKLDEITYPLVPPKTGRANNGGIIFYGSVSGGSMDHGRLISVIESSRIWLRSGINNNRESITCGKWIVRKPFELAAFVHHQKFHEINQEAKNLHMKMKEEVRLLPEIKNELLLLLEFFAEEFSKKVQEEWEYKISAAITEIAIDGGLGGVFYPSYQTEYRGFNVALKRDIVDDCLELHKVLAGDIHNKGDRTIVDNCLIATSINEGKFVYEEVSYSDKVGNAFLKKFYR